MIDGPIWNDRQLIRFDSQQGTIHCKTLIVGGGLCGLLTAFELIEQGVNGSDIVIIDSKRLLCASSVRATAKLTSQHGIIYERLIRCFGLEQAQQYATANQNAIIRAHQIATKLNMHDCITSRSAYLYATDSQQLEALNKEYTSAKVCSIMCKQDVSDELPFTTKGSLAFINQAAIHPKAFAEGIVNYITKRGCKIYEKTTALAIQDNAVFTDKGKIFTQKTVISTRFPFVDKRGLYFVKLHQQRSYLLSIKGVKPIIGMYLGVGKDGYTLRQAEDHLIFGGGVCRNGLGDYSHFFELVGKASEYFEGCEVTHRWSNEDVVTNDGIPYIGINNHLPGTYIATGFGMWGMSSSFVAAKIISSEITHGYAENSEIFSPSRSMFKSGKKNFAINAMEVASEFSAVLKQKPKHSRTKTGVRLEQDTDGRTKLFAPLCSHMKCPLRWNKEEHCWDCTCHGSRFDKDGNVISGPAIKKLEFHGKFDNM